MKCLHIGDRVQIINRDSEYYDKVGYIGNMKPPTRRYIGSNRTYIINSAFRYRIHFEVRELGTDWFDRQEITINL